MRQAWKLRQIAVILSIGVLLVQMGLASEMQAQMAARSNASSTGQTTGAQSAGNMDWSRAVVESTMKRYPNPSELGSWGYAKALYLFGEYLVWKRTGDSRYLQYVKGWVDSHVDGQGNMDHNTESLDAIMPANLFLLLYQETKEEKYKLAADKVRQRFNTYPRTADGGFWHATGASRAHQLWGDGVFMGMPFLVRYGRLYGESPYANDEAAKQLIVYASHLHSSEGLLYHAYDESGASRWADPTTHHSAELWGRAMGWFGMTLIDVLEVLPAHDPKRTQLIATLQDLVRGLAKYQDSQTGLWYQVVDKGSVPGNWLETSSSSMYSYIISMAVRRGYVDKTYDAIANKGYRGVLTKISLDSDGLANIADICEGTNVADLDYYFARKRNINDFHGLGAFLIMNEYFLTHSSMMELTSPPRKTVKFSITNPTDQNRVEDIVLKVADIQRPIPDFTAESATVMVGTTTTPGKDASSTEYVELPSQADDLDGDGRADELAFQIDLQPRQTRTVTVASGAIRGLASSQAGYPKRTDAKFAKHYDGMGWESETTAWRLYFDKRNAIDLWGKKKQGLYLETFAQPDYKYQEESPRARDIYNVGKSLGAGGVGALVDGHAIPVSDVSSRNWRIISTGPVRSIVEFTYVGWKVGDRSLALTSRITQWAGEHGYEHRVTTNAASSFPLVVGFTRKSDLKEIVGSPSCSLAIWGHQVVRPGTGATEALPDQNLGLAISVPNAPKDCQVSGDPSNYLVRPQIKDGEANWYVLAAWDQEEVKPVSNAKDLAALVKQESVRLSQPASVKVLSTEQKTIANANSTADAKPASTAASDSVKLFSSAEVQAAFEKGSPLVTKDGRNYWVIAGRRDKPGQSELHEKDLDVFYILQGSSTFITGGKMVEGKTTAPGEVRGSAIEGGEVHTLSKGDVIVIPAGVPHWFKDVQGLFLYYVVKVQQP